LHITLAVGDPFEGIVLTHYNCCLGHLWNHSTCTLQFLLVAPLKARYLHIAIVVGARLKQGTYTLRLLLGASLKVEYLHINFFQGPLQRSFKAEYLHNYVVLGGPFESRLLLNCSCCWGPFWKQRTCRLVSVGGLWKQSTYLWSALWYIIWVDNRFFTKNKEILHA